MVNSMPILKTCKVCLWKILLCRSRKIGLSTISVIGYRSRQIEFLLWDVGLDVSNHCGGLFKPTLTL